MLSNLKIKCLIVISKRRNILTQKNTSWEFIWNIFLYLRLNLETAAAILAFIIPALICGYTVLKYIDAGVKTKGI